jgi:hypothetical protein
MDQITWENHVSIFKNPFILKGLVISIGIPFGLLILAIIVFSGGNIMDSDAKYALLMIVLLFLFTYFFILIIYKGKYAPGFIINDEGIINYTQTSQGKKNKMINTLTIFLSLFSRNFSAAGAGVLAKSKQTEKIKWKEVRKVKYYPKRNTILVYGGFTQKIAVFCIKDNYSLIEKTIKKKTK